MFQLSCLFTHWLQKLVLYLQFWFCILYEQPLAVVKEGLMLEEDSLPHVSPHPQALAASRAKPYLAALTFLPRSPSRTHS
jgi:hypothetical protein